MISSAHDISEGGLFVNLAESGFFKNLGFAVVQTNQAIRSDAWWFGEAQGRVVVSVNKDNIAAFEKSLEIPFEKLGEVTSSEVIINNENWGSITEWKTKYDKVIEGFMNK